MRGMFQTPPQEPPIATLLAILIPPAIFLILQTSGTVRTQTLAINPVLLTAVQGLPSAWRAPAWVLRLRHTVVDEFSYERTGREEQLDDYQA